MTTQTATFDTSYRLGQENHAEFPGNKGETRPKKFPVWPQGPTSRGGPTIRLPLLPPDDLVLCWQ